jgi:hypothetical protein
MAQPPSSSWVGQPWRSGLLQRELAPACLHHTVYDIARGQHPGQATAAAARPELFTSTTPAAGEMLHVAEPFLERNLHPTVIVRGFRRALEDAIKVRL